MASLVLFLLVVGICRNSKTKKEVVGGIHYQVTPQLPPAIVESIWAIINTLQRSLEMPDKNQTYHRCDSHNRIQCLKARQMVVNRH